MGDKRIVGLGAGGHARSVLDAVLSTQEWTVVGLVDADATIWGRRILDVPVLGDDSRLPELHGDGVEAAFIGIGGVRDNSAREAAYVLVRRLGFDLPVIRHRAAVVAPSAQIGDGSAVLAAAVIGAEARIGANVIVNTGAVVEHECVIGDHCHVATGARLGGRVVVGSGAHVGIGAVVLQGIAVGERAVIGAGAVVVDDVPAGSVVVGSPARPIKQRA